MSINAYRSCYKVFNIDARFKEFKFFITFYKTTPYQILCRCVKGFYNFYTYVYVPPHRGGSSEANRRKFAS